MGKVIMSGIVPKLTKPSGLPAGYTRLEYIQSSGTQAIDTEFSVGPDNYNKVRFEVDCEKIGAGSGTRWMTDGASNTDYFYVGVYNGLVYYACGGTADMSTGKAYPGGRSTFVLDAEKGIVSATGVSDTKITVNQFSSSAPLHLCGYSHASGTHRYFAQDLYASKIEVSGVLVRDFVPCISPSGEVGMYERIRKKFHGNIGTGVFIGSEVT